MRSFGRPLKAASLILGRGPPWSAWPWNVRGCAAMSKCHPAGCTHCVVHCEYEVLTLDPTLFWKQGLCESVRSTPSAPCVLQDCTPASVRWGGASLHPCLAPISSEDGVWRGKRSQRTEGRDSYDCTVVNRRARRYFSRDAWRTAVVSSCRRRGLDVTQGVGDTDLCGWLPWRLCPIWSRERGEKATAHQRNGAGAALQFHLWQRPGGGGGGWDTRACWQTRGGIVHGIIMGTARRCHGATVASGRGFGDPVGTGSRDLIRNKNFIEQSLFHQAK